jgi:hypothetical protein
MTYYDKWDLDMLQFHINFPIATQEIDNTERLLTKTHFIHFPDFFCIVVKNIFIFSLFTFLFQSLKVRTFNPSYKKVNFLE